MVALTYSRRRALMDSQSKDSDALKPVIATRHPLTYPDAYFVP